MHRDRVVEEFTRQAAAFEGAAVFHGADTLGALVDLVPPGTQGRWLEVACGTGAVARALAARVDEVVGVDVTPAMLDVARRAAGAEAVANVRYAPGDATALPFGDGEFAGAATRFSLHHIPAPGRVVLEMARVVRPGGYVIVADHLTDAEGEAAAWHQEIERLRDPSHWSCLTGARLRRLGEGAGLALDAEAERAFELDYDDWLSRGSAGPANAALIQALLDGRPPGAESFRVIPGGRLRLRLGLIRWRRPRPAP